MKTCSTCNIEKSLEEFNKDKNKPDGLDRRCRDCRKISRSNSYFKNIDKEKSKQKEYRESNKDKIKENDKLYYQENKEIISLKRKEYRLLNKDKISKSDKIYRNNNKLKIKEYKKLHYIQNVDLYLSVGARRRASKHQATPSWLTQEQLEEIKDFYTACQMFKIYTGLTYHVDHIIPLQGDNVCGLHVPWNLQILEASENLSKSNKLLEEYSN